MTDSTPFSRLVGERLRRLVDKDGRTIEAISLAAGKGAHTVSRIVHGHAVKVETLFTVLHEMKATREDVSATYVDFVECQKERADG